MAATNNTAWDLVTPFIPLFILSLVEGDPVAAAAWSGIALGISPLMTAVAGPFWGAFAERYGARSAMLRTLLKPVSKANASYWSLLRSPEVLLISTVVFVGQYVERTFWPLAPLLVVEMEPGSDQLGLMTGLVLGIGSGATALSALVVGRLARRVSPRLLLLASLAFGCLTLPLLAAMGSFWQFVAARVVMGLLTGGVVTLAYAHVSTVLPSERLSVSFSMFASIAMVASAVGPVSLSTLASSAGLRSPLIVGAIGFACCFVPLLVAGRQSAGAGAARRQVGLPGGNA